MPKIVSWTFHEVDFYTIDFTASFAHKPALTWHFRFPFAQ